MKKLGGIIIFALDVLAFLCLGVLFFLTFIGVQVASWAGSNS